MSVIKQISNLVAIKTPKTVRSRRFSCSAKPDGICLTLSETSRELQNISRKFSREHIIPKAAYYDKTGEYPWDILKRAHDIGIMNPHTPSEFGGMNLSSLDECVISEEIGYGCSGVGVTIEATNMAQIPLTLAGNKELKKKYLGKCISEPIVAALCYTEPNAGSDFKGIQTKAQRKGDDYILNGQKMHITNGGVASWYFVVARTNVDSKAPISKAFTCFIVDKDSPGLRLGKKEINMGQRASDTRSIVFEDVRVPKENVVGAEGMGFKIVMKSFDRSRVPVAASAVGLAQRCLDEATKYALERKAFGVPIAQHQAVAFMLADMAIGIESARLACYKAALEIDRNGGSSYYSSIAKTLSSNVANKCATDAVQIFGGNGFNNEYPVEKLMRDAKIFQIYEGTSEIQRIIISSAVLEKARQTQ